MRSWSAFLAVLLVAAPLRADRPPPEPPPPPDLEPLFEAALRLADPKGREAATQQLMAAGEDGLGVLIKVARGAGDEGLLAAASDEVECRALALSLTADAAPGIPTNPSTEAARLLARRLSTDEAARLAMARSPAVVQRQLALVALFVHRDRLLVGLALPAEKSAEVLVTALALADCAMAPRPCGPDVVRGDGPVSQPQCQDVTASEVLLWDAAYQKLRDRLDSTPADCAGPGPGPAADRIRDEVLAGRFTSWGWSRGGKVVKVTATARTGLRSTLSASCAFAVYEGAVAKGRYVPELLEGMLSRSAPAEVRDRAANLLTRDLEKLVDRRDHLLVSLVNLGYPMTARVTLAGEPGLLDDEPLAAAARQGDAKALASIRRAVDCAAVDAGKSGVRLLGFLKGKDVADLAYRLGTTCKRGASGAAAALLRLQDPRGPKLLEAALSERAGEIEDDLRELWAPVITAELERLAAKEGPAKQRARQLLDEQAPPR